ncbi:MAG: adenylate/guanylate cyclase domain-containing protein, partial [Burkholderiales bacterium]|nr:adenylate/guanylate cyclase domain-containing protein [Opitutaceae bacterium]
LPDHWREITAGPDAIERLSQYEAVRLFIDRATMARPAFQLSDANVQTVAQICWRLDGIPLAIELAAARIRVLTLQQIVERLDDRFRLLTTGTRTAVPRQQTLRALIDWSYDLLTDPERQLLRRLSVFARGRTLEAIEAVCTGDGLEAWEIIDLLSQLVDKSLINVEKTPELGARYFMLESIWDYAHEKLAEAGEAAVFRERHLDYFLRLAEDAAPKIRGPAQREWLARIEQEDMNMRFAVEASEELPGQISKGLRILAATERFMEVRGLFKKARAVFDRLLMHPDAAPRDAIRAEALAAAGRLAWLADDCPACQLAQEEALHIFRELGDTRGTAIALADLGFLALDASDLPRARLLFDEANALGQTLGDPRVTAHVSHTRAALTAAEHDFSQARALDEEALALYREVGDTWLASIVSWGAGMNAAVLGDFDAARAHFTECLRIGIELGIRWGASYPLEAFAALAVAERKYDRAARLFGAAETQRARSGLVPQAADHPALLQILADAPGFTGPAIDAARREGRALNYDDAIKLALCQTDGLQAVAG